MSADVCAFVFLYVLSSAAFIYLVCRLMCYVFAGMCACLVCRYVPVCLVCGYVRSTRTCFEMKVNTVDCVCFILFPLRHVSVLTCVHLVLGLK